MQFTVLKSQYITEKLNYVAVSLSVTIRVSILIDSN